MLNPRPLTQIQQRPLTILKQRPITVTTLPTLHLSAEEKKFLVDTARDVSDPVTFAQRYLKTEIWDTQAEIMRAILEYPRVAVKACHSSSKTFSAALITLWFLAYHSDEAVVVTTAPGFTQVEKQLWGEIHSALERCAFPFNQKANQVEFKLGPKRYAYGTSTSVTKGDEGVRFQGIHGKNVLLIIDEAPGVHPKIWEAIEGNRAGGKVSILALGNPTIASGPFHTAFVEQRSGWKTFTIDAFDTPNLRGVSLEQLLAMPEHKDGPLDQNICPYLVTRRWVKEKYYEWGVDNPLWEARVRGNFPKQSQDALLSLSWLEAAAKRENEVQAALKTDQAVEESSDYYAGVDVAGPGDDETSLTIRRGNRIIFHQQWTKADPRGEIVAALNPFKNHLKAVNVDSVAIGWYLHLHLKDLGFPSVPINVSESSSDTDKYANTKSELYWALRLLYQNNQIIGPTDEKTIGQLAGIRYGATSKGQTVIESKEDARKRGVRSPDRAESIMLCFGNRLKLYGALDFFKELAAMQKTQSSTLMKPMTTDNQIICPTCSAVCVSPCQGGYRCNSCGKQWDSPSEKNKIPQFSRNDLFKRQLN